MRFLNFNQSERPRNIFITANIQSYKEQLQVRVYPGAETSELPRSWLFALN